MKSGGRMPQPESAITSVVRSSHAGVLADLSPGTTWIFTFRAPASIALSSKSANACVFSIPSDLRFL
jgi:hypothetical protein